MKIAHVLILLLLSLTNSAHASGPITIDINTTDAGVTYDLHDYDLRVEKDRQTPDEIEAWIRKRIAELPQHLVVIQPDDRTAFKTVFEMLRRFKSAGVNQFAVVTHEGANVHSVIGSTDKISSTKIDVAPPRK